jgi:hypothetical protein
MAERIDVGEAGRTAEARALLDRLGDSEVISLGVLSGADLCALGATWDPVCWEALRGAWCRLDENERGRLTDTSGSGMLRRGLVHSRPAGPGDAGPIGPTSYQPSAELGILLGGRQSLAMIIATHHESRTPAITYFQPQGADAFVEEIPERVDNVMQGTPRSPLNVIFGYRLLTPAFAARELARWAFKPVQVTRYQPKPPRLICFFACGEDVSPASYQLTIHAEGDKAHVDGPDISAELDGPELTSLMAEVTSKWAAACSSSFSPDSLGRLPGDDEAGVALAQDVAGGEVGVGGFGGEDG